MSVGNDQVGKKIILPAEFLELIQRRQDVDFIFSHFGGGLPFYALMPEIKKQYQHVWFDTSFDHILLRHDTVSCIENCIDKDHLLYGSHIPVVVKEEESHD